MKFLAAISALFLLAFMAAPVPAQERQDDREKGKIAQPQEQQRSPEETKDQKNEKKQDEKAQEPRSVKPEQPRSDQEKPAEPPHGKQPEVAQPHQEHQPAQMQHEHGRPVQAERGKHIPDDKFRSSFGPRHTFHVQRAQIVNNPQPVIVYGGYSFELVDAWPADWSYDDDCYIDYVDEQYFLFDPLHPGFRIALIVIG